MQIIFTFIDQISLYFRWKTFLITFISIFLMVTLQYLGVKLPAIIFLLSQTNQNIKLASPIAKQTLFSKIISPRLSQIPNDFHVKKVSSFIPSANADAEYSQAIAYVAIDMETGEVIIDKNLTKKVSIASTTKIMTAVVALDLASPGEVFTVSEKAEDIVPTKIGVVAGQKMTLEELLNALMLTSANDAAEVIKEGIDAKYGEEVFIKAMNTKATAIGLKNSHYTNPQGFDHKEHYSCAEDLAVLTTYAMKNYPLFASIVAKDYEFLSPNENHKQFDLYNWNGLLGTYPGVDGVKIGNTDDAGNTTVVTSQREGKRIVAVLLGAPGVLKRDLWTSQILDLAFEKSAGLEPINLTESTLKEKYSTWKYWN